MTVYRNFRDPVSGQTQELWVEGGRVVSRHSAGDATPSGEQAEVVDLAGQWILPAFVDAHCHILPTGLDLQKLSLGTAASREEVLDLVRQRHRDQPDGWLLAVHYDQNKFSDGGHLDRDQLDRISSDRPILLRHVNGHASVVNSAALKAAAVNESVANPPGGEFARDAVGRLSGLLLEHAHEQVSRFEPAPTQEEMVDAILRAGEKMRDFGIACASDMMTGRFDLRRELAAYRMASERGCRIATRLYVQWSQVFGPRALHADEFNELCTELPISGGKGSRIVGIKIFADGAIGSATAAIYGSYSGQSANGPVISRGGQEAGATTEREVSGQLIYRPERLKQMVMAAHAEGWPVAVHAIGDYAADLVMDAFEATDEPSRHRIEHAMILSDAQISRLARLGCSVTFQPEFLLRFGTTYRRQLGVERARRLKRVRSVLDAGIPLSFNSDRPIVGGNPWDGIRIATTREGFDPSERCSLKEAITAYTVGGSRVNDDGDAYGTLEPGSVAEFQLFAENPMESIS